MNFRSMDEFWVFYISQHSKPGTRRCHFVGTLLCFLTLLCALCFSWWLLLLLPVVQTAFSFTGHFFVERNVPSVFGHPVWSLLCDLKMFGLMLTGGMDEEIKRVTKRPVLQTY